MKILLFNPPRYNGIPVIREERCEIIERNSVLEPYSLLQLAAILRGQGHAVTLADANGFNLSYDDVQARMEGHDIMVFRFTPTTFDNDMKAAELFKAKNPRSLAVGICFTLRTLSREILAGSPHLDIYVKSDYEIVVPDLIKNIKSPGRVPGITYRKGKKVIENPDARQAFNYNSLPVPAYDMLPSLDPYFINTPHVRPFTIMYTSRGCCFSCAYCTVAGTRLRMRSAESIEKEIKYLKEIYNIRLISFFDETFTINRERAMKLCSILEPTGIHWYCNTRTSLVDEELLKAMYRAGCRGISFGIESGSQKILDSVSKGITVAQQEQGIRLAKKAGLKVYCSFIVGLPGETRETVEETISFIRRTIPTSAQINVAVPYPGTKLYETAKKNKWISEINWRDLYQHKSMIRMNDLSPKEIDALRLRIYRSLYFNPRWIMQNVAYVARHPEDLSLALNYSKKILKNFFIFRMEHSH